jgi:alkylresorcinol/alkylpyrone synthase
MQPVKLISIATAVPPHAIEQRDAAAAAHHCFGTRYSDFKRLARVFESSGIRRRYAMRPLEWYFEPLGWPERTAAYLEGACQLFVDAASKALHNAGITATEVDTVVTISSTGIATPSLEARVASRIGFRADVERVSGFSIASRLAQSRPGSFVLLVAVELCTLAFRLDELTKANIVATALFGDGAMPKSSPASSPVSRCFSYCLNASVNRVTKTSHSIVVRRIPRPPEQAKHMADNSRATKGGQMIRYRH